MSVTFNLNENEDDIDRSFYNSPNSNVK